MSSEIQDGEDEQNEQQHNTRRKKGRVTEEESVREENYDVRTPLVLETSL